MQGHRLIIHRQDLLLPSYLRIVHLRHDGTDAMEIFLTRITGGQSAGQSPQQSLWDLRNERHITHHISAVHTQSEVGTILADLGIRRDE